LIPTERMRIGAGGVRRSGTEPASWMSTAMQTIIWVFAAARL
jgi:hypothetical protein